MAEIDREKVIRGLSVCGHDAGVPNQCELFDCPYRVDAWCQHELAGDALALIHGQDEEVANLTTKIAELTTERARVMTLEEAVDCNYCWFETHNWKNGDHFIPVLRALAMDDDSGRTFIDQNDDLFGFRDEEYGETVRCWTARPTEAQREATAWGG